MSMYHIGELDPASCDYDPSFGAWMDEYRAEQEAESDRRMAAWDEYWKRVSYEDIRWDPKAHRIVETR